MLIGECLCLVGRSGMRGLQLHLVAAAAMGGAVEGSAQHSGTPAVARSRSSIPHRQPISPPCKRSLGLPCSSDPLGLLLHPPSGCWANRECACCAEAWQRPLAARGKRLGHRRCGLQTEGACTQTPTPGDIRTHSSLIRCPHRGLPSCSVPRRRRRRRQAAPREPRCWAGPSRLRRCWGEAVAAQHACLRPAGSWVRRAAMPRWALACPSLGTSRQRRCSGPCRWACRCWLQSVGEPCTCAH